MRKKSYTPYLFILMLFGGFGCSSDSDPLSARAARPSPEQINALLEERYRANKNISDQIEAIGGRIELLLDLSYTGMNNEDLQNLDFPAHLTRLNLAGTAVTDEGLEKLKECKNLQILDLDHTRVTDDCLEFIKELPALHTLKLNGTDVSPAAQVEMVRLLRTRRPTVR